MDPISRLIFLYKKRKDKDAKISLMFYTCLDIILLVDVFYGYFFYHTSKIMYIINTICLFLNIFIYYLFEKNKRLLGVQILLFELHVFLICATLIIGWEYGFHQYIFGMLCIFYLPFYLPERIREGNKSVILNGFVFIITYYILDYICNDTNIAPGISNTIFSSTTIYAVNSFISIAAVSAFCIISSMINVEDNKKLKRKADFDELTQIYNRYGLNQLLEDKINDKNVKSFYVSIADIDFFKKVNDTYGHNCGDLVLQDVASTLKKITKNGVYVGRWGGEEFLIIGEATLTHNEFSSILEKVRKHYEDNYINVYNNKIKITMSFGIGKYSKGKSIERIVKDTDDNLYTAKESGRNRIIG